MIARVAGACIFLLSCNSGSPLAPELSRAVAIGRRGWGLFDEIGAVCRPGARAAEVTGTCRIERAHGPAGVHFFESEHAIAFTFESDDGLSRVAFESFRDAGVSSVRAEGSFVSSGALLRMDIERVEASEWTADRVEVESVLRGFVEQGGVRAELEEVRDHARTADVESFYRLYTNTWVIPDDSFTLGDGAFEGEREGSGPWMLSSEGTLLGSTGIVGSVELRGDGVDAHPVLAFGGSTMEL